MYLVDGVGTVDIYGVNPSNGKAVRMELYDVRYSPNFHRQTASRQEKGLQYPTLTPDDLMFATKYSEMKKSAQEPRAKASTHTWHRRLGHIGQQRIAKLAEMTEGITIESNPGKEKQACEACQLADAPKQISRRHIGQKYGVFGRVHFDLVQNQPAYNGHIWLTHFYLDGIKCHFVFTHTRKNECQMAVRKFRALVRNWLKIEIRVFHYNNKRSAGHEVEAMIEAEGCTIEHSPPNLPEMNGPAERSGGQISVTYHYPRTGQIVTFILGEEPSTFRKFHFVLGVKNRMPHVTIISQWQPRLD
ncbi:Polynucleotidyl transferase, ribonuclease H fold [Penicillium digitatum]|uniref:Polynucleotidyl transferase, ribonuclease H fold n=1 Tax=Penicillium digitatum TaxID=36651 RepID=A0A7T7BJ16_PENDI|nr:Polynucleotidyl transferase, ribonuclease H fold [Penicillium digitatum]